MTKEEHRKRHHELHMALDELVADWIHAASLGARGPSNSYISDLMLWAGQQTIKLDHEPEGVHEEG